MNEKQRLYDELCNVLTGYEGKELDEQDLYKMLVKIQNKWEDTITSIE